MLKLSKTIRFREEDFGGVVFRKEDNFFLELNKKGYHLLSSFQDFKRIAEASIKFPEFILLVKKLGIIKNCDKDLENKIKYDRTSTSITANQRRLKEGFLRAPLEVGVEITSKCQLNCIHCYGAFNNKINNHKSKELCDKEIYNLIDQLNNIGVFAIFIGGGEPLLNPHFFDICRYILSKDINVVVSTNGVEIDKKIADSSVDLGSYVGIQISLEGANESINDSIRGKGSFRKAIRGLKLLQQAGLNPTIGTTITSLNYNSIEEIVSLAYSLEVPHIHFMCLMPSGRGNVFYERLKLTTDQKVSLTKKMRKLKERYKRKIGIDCANFYQQPPSKGFNPDDSYDLVDRIYAGCEATRVKAVVTASGDVIGCEILRDLKGGNIRENSFIDIWENNDVFKYIRSRNAQSIEGKCKTCKYVVACVGDCPSYSTYHRKSFFAGGEECPHEPEKSIYKIIE